MLPPPPGYDPVLYGEECPHCEGVGLEPPAEGWLENKDWPYNLDSFPL